MGGSGAQGWRVGALVSPTTYRAGQPFAVTWNTHGPARRHPCTPLR
jgi:hypothetical protein